MLQKNVAGYENIICENSGLWNKEASLKVYDKYDSGKWAMIVEESKDEGQEIKGRDSGYSYQLPRGGCPGLFWTYRTC